MLLSPGRITQIILFICTFGGIFVFGKLPLWIAATALLLPILFLDTLFNRPKINTVFFIFTLVLVTVSIINMQATQVQTIFYSLFLCSVFLLSKRKIEICDTKTLINIYKYVVFSFFVLIIMGLFLHFLFGMNEIPLAKVDISRGIPRSFGPSTEPSFSALTLTIAMWVLCSSKNNSPISIRVLLITYLISIVLIGSGIGFLTCVFLLIYIFTLSNIKIFQLEKVIIILFSLSILPFLSFDIDRLKPLLEVLGDFVTHGSLWDLFDAIKYADASAWFRFGPFVEYFRDFDISQLSEFLLGNGAGTSTTYFGNKYILHIDPEWFGADGKPNLDLPFFPAFLYDYGIIASFILLYFIWNLMKTIKGVTLLIPLALFIFFNSNFNTSMFWFFIYSLLVINILQKKESLIEKN
jgi:hypothetical protein